MTRKHFTVRGRKIVRVTYDTAHAAGWDAGNRHAKAAGRDHWDGSDYAESVRVFNEVINGED